MGFTLSDIFPVKKGDLCEISPQANEYFRRMSRDPDNAGLEVDGHELMGQNLIALSNKFDHFVVDQYGKRKYTGDILIDVYSQQTMKMYTIDYDYLQRVLF